ncbi:MAG TPA: WYL domain-containing protein [Acidimicrobiales bacterium]|nr:WYL domain-containing protein [Acidimicrobiales bacterium]
MATRADAGSRLLRLLAVLTWLARVGRAPVSELSERFGLDPDELIADLELAACCGLPPYSPDQLMEIIVDDQEVVADLGAELARPRKLTAAEGFALAASARAIAAVPGADPDGALRRAAAKLDAVLGGRTLLRIDLREPAHLAIVRDAAERGRQLELRYYSASSDRESRRVVDPVDVVSIEGRWYLDGYCHNAESMRRFRVDRVSSARLTGEPACHGAPAATATAGAATGRPGDAHRDGEGDGRAGPGAEAFVPGPEATVAHLAVDDEAAWIIEALPTFGTEPLRDGRTRVTLAVASTVWFGRLLLRLGPHAEVLDPPELAQAGRQAARQLLSRYRTPRP